MTTKAAAVLMRDRLQARRRKATAGKSEVIEVGVGQLFRTKLERYRKIIFLTREF